jgi:hypothetical protein
LKLLSLHSLGGTTIYVFSDMSVGNPDAVQTGHLLFDPPSVPCYLGCLYLSCIVTLVTVSAVGSRHHVVLKQTLLCILSRNMKASCLHIQPLLPKLQYCYCYRSRGSSVTTVSGYGLHDWEIEFDLRQGQEIFPLTSVSRPALRPTQPPAQWVLGSFPLW